MVIFKSEPNEINAIIKMIVDEESFTLEYTYDNENIYYDELITMSEVKNKVEELRKQGLKGFVVNTNISNTKIPY